MMQAKFNTIEVRAISDGLFDNIEKGEATFIGRTSLCFGFHGRDDQTRQRVSGRRPPIALRAPDLQHHFNDAGAGSRKRFG